jgi:hypothetical protein
VLGTKTRCLAGRLGPKFVTRTNENEEIKDVRTSHAT